MQTRFDQYGLEIPLCKVGCLGTPGFAMMAVGLKYLRSISFLIICEAFTVNTCRLVSFLLAFLLLCEQSSGQISRFEEYANIVRDIDELEADFSDTVESNSILLKHQAELLAAIRESSAHTAQLEQSREWQNFRLFESELRRAAMESSFRSLKESGERGSLKLPQVNGARQLTNEFGVTVRAGLELQLHINGIKQQLLTLDKAGQILLQRRFEAVQELQSLQPKFAPLREQNLKLLDKYWEVSDVPGYRSQLELRLARDALHKSAPENKCADLAESITLIRLGDYNAASKLLAALVHTPGIAPLALACRAELHIRQGDKNKFNADWQLALKLAPEDARIWVHHAVCMELMGDIPAATRNWEKVLAKREYNHWARRALSLLQTARPDANKGILRKASENALIATKLSAESDWGSMLALAFVQASEGDKPAAIKSAELAADLALGNNQHLCIEVAQQIEKDLPRSWRSYDQSP